MVNSFLFGNQSSSQSKYLVEFKAGKMKMKGTTVNPISKKGLVYLHRADDNLMHFCWKDRQSGQVEDDLIIFPDDTEFKKVPQCTTGRVFVLKFKSSNRRCFYWMQEPKVEKDDDICKKVNEFLNNPSASTSTSRNSSGLGGSSLTDLPESELHNLINNVNSQQLMQILSRVNGGMNSQVLANLLNQSASGGTSSSGSSRLNRHSGSSSSRSSSTKQSSNSTSSNNNNQDSTTATTASTTTNTTTATTNTLTSSATPAAVSNTSAGIQLSDLQNIISGLAVNQTGKKEEEITVDLASIVNSDALKTLLENKEFMDKVKELIPDLSDVDLPVELQQTLSEQVSSTIESVQFKSALGTFNSALQSGLLGPLVQQFNLSDACVEAANKGGLYSYLLNC